MDVLIDEETSKLRPGCEAARTNLIEDSKESEMGFADL